MTTLQQTTLQQTTLQQTATALRPAAPVRPPLDQQSGETRAGIGLMVLSMALLPVSDTFSKLLTQALPPFEITAWRLFFQMAVLTPVATLLLRKRLRGSMFSGPAALSGLLVVLMMLAIVQAFTVMPIATAIAIFFVEPLFLTLLSGPLLGERAGPRRYAAVAVGLTGALIVIRPSFAAFGWTALLPLAAAFLYALNVILLRKAGRDRSSLTIQCGATIVAALIMAVLTGAGLASGLTQLRAFDAPAWIWLLLPLAGMLSAVTFILVAEAFRRAEASLLAPFQYLEILGATLLGYLVFGDVPDELTLLGTSIILLSGVYVFHREQKAAQR
jgi:drug/metabolite transporter (DMT)-like permease